MTTIKKILPFFFLLWLSQTSWAKEVPPLTSPVIDQAGILSPTSKQAFETILRGFKKQNGAQVQLYIIKSLEDESLEGYTIKVVDEWKLGDEKKDDGLLFLISMKDKKMRIEVGQGLEGTLTDLKAGRIIDHLRVHFKKGEFEKGISVGLNLIIKVLGGDIQNIPKARGHYQRRRRSPVGDFSPLLIIGLFLLLSFFRRRSSGLFLLGSASSFGSSSSGFSGGFSSGGSSWGGGGGGFSGGGASGGW
jgi:uncharacterized protein